MNITIENNYSSGLSESLYNTEDAMFENIDEFIDNISTELRLYERYIYEELRIIRLTDMCLANYSEYSPKNFYAYLYNEIVAREGILIEE